MRLRYRDILFDIVQAGLVGVTMLVGSTAPSAPNAGLRGGIGATGVGIALGIGPTGIIGAIRATDERRAVPIYSPA
jgi:hypothetical protein